jgi:hypothetical protein
MRPKLCLALAAVVAVFGIGVSPAGAHTVGTPGEPNCHGLRISHGSSDHDLTPRDRVNELNSLLSLDVDEVALDDPEFAGFLLFLHGFFGDEATVREFQQFVRANCEA